MNRLAWIAALPGFVLLAYFSSQLFATGYVYRYKLTIDAGVNGQIRRASTVVQLAERTVSFPHAARRVTVNGEALFLDFGPDRPPLIALLDTIDSSGSSVFGPEQIAKAYGVTTPWDFKNGRNVGLAALIKLRGPKEIPLESLPTLVTFSPVSDPRSAVWVDPFKPQDTLGDGVEILKSTLEITTEPLTTGLNGKLPWLVAMSAAWTQLSGRTIRLIQTVEPANHLSSVHFKRSEN